MKRVSSFLPSQPLARLAISALALLPAAALAHPGHYHPGEDDEFDAFGAGILHPFSGVDHLLLSIAAGWIAFIPGQAKAKISFAAFLLSMTAGAWMGRGLHGGMTLEIMLASTMLVAGALVLFAKKSPRLITTLAISTAGLVHGFAHGSEAAAEIPFAQYSCGFLLGTAILMGLGSLLHRATKRFHQPMIPRIAGGVLIAAGSIALTQAL